MRPANLDVSANVIVPAISWVSTIVTAPAIKPVSAKQRVLTDTYSVYSASHSKREYQWDSASQQRCERHGSYAAKHTVSTTTRVQPDMQ